MQNRTSIILADNQDITAIGIYYFLQKKDDSSSFHFLEAENKQDLICKLSYFPDAVVILDYFLFDFFDLNDLVSFCKKFPSAHFLLFLEEVEDKFLKHLIYSRYDFSVLLKKCLKEEIISAIDIIIEGGVFICDSIVFRIEKIQKCIISVNKDNKKLTQSEQNVLRQLALGVNTKELAHQRSSSIHTIITHRKNIFRKLKVNNLQEAIRYALRVGIITVDDYCI